MESPVKKLDFNAADKENMPFDESSIATSGDEMDAKYKPAAEEAKATEKPSIVSAIKADEADEPLLQENPQRFVLFPIKYHEVRVARRVLTRRVLP